MFKLFINGLSGKLGFMLREPADENGSNDGSSGDGDSGNSNGDAGEKTFKQADVDRIVNDRVARAYKTKDSEWSKKFGDITPEEISAFRESKENQRKAEAEAFEKDKKYNDHLSKIQAAHKAELEKLSGTNTTLLSRLERTIVDNSIFGALSKHKLVESAPQQIAGIIRQNIKVSDLDSGKTEVVDADGNFIPDSSGVPHTLETYVAEWLDKNPHFLLGSGGGSGYKGAPGSKSAIFTRKQLQDPVFYQENKEAILLAYKEGRIKN